MVIYDIKHCLSGKRVIYERQSDYDGHKEYAYSGEGIGRMQHIMGRDAYANKVAARAAAEAMRGRKIASLEKQIAKLKAAVFTIEKVGP